MLGIIRERLAEPDAASGFILDGFPRNLAQAEALAAMLKGIGQPLDAVVLLEVDYAEIARRIAGRRTCPKCGTMFNVHDSAAGRRRIAELRRPPELVQRPDDNEATVVGGSQVYESRRGR